MAHNQPYRQSIGPARRPSSTITAATPLPTGQRQSTSSGTTARVTASKRIATKDRAMGHRLTKKVGSKHG